MIKMNKNKYAWYSKYKNAFDEDRYLKAQIGNLWWNEQDGDFRKQSPEEFIKKRVESNRY